RNVTGVQTCALPIYSRSGASGIVSSPIALPIMAGSFLLDEAFAKNSAVYFFPIETLFTVVEFKPRFFQRAGLARVLGTFVAVDVRRNIPGFLIGQGKWLAQRHIRLDEACGRIDTCHSGAPVIGVRPPQRREHNVTFWVLLTLTVCAMAEHAVLCVHSLSAEHI